MINQKPEEKNTIPDTVLQRIRKAEKHLDKIRGSLFGGAVGDALGYAVEFCREKEIFAYYGSGGIRDYELAPSTGKALISDDTQMALFTAPAGNRWPSESLCAYVLSGLAENTGYDI